MIIGIVALNIIVGAGPAGLEAAVDLTERGFRPIVFEKSDRAGGLINLAALPPCKGNLNSITDYRVRYLEKAGISIRFNQGVTPETIRQEAPGLLILATGSVAAIPDIPGIHSENVLTGDEVLQGAKISGKRVASLGGGMIGCEVADYLAQQAKAVVIFDMADGIVNELTSSRRHFMLERMSQAGVKINLLTSVRAIHLPMIDTAVQGYPQTYDDFDAVVVAAGRKPVNLLTAQIAERFPDIKVITIGDAKQPGLAMDAIRQSAEIAAESGIHACLRERMGKRCLR